MTPEAQRTAIEKACGDKWWVALYPGDPLRRPDYLNDLNAMHEAEKVLTDDQVDSYTLKLLVQVAHFQRTNYAWHATAAQRAEAFLRTLGLWKC